MKARHPKEFFVVNGKPCWAIVVDGIDHAVLHMVRYHRAQQYQFHHGFYLPTEFHDRLKNSEISMLWGDERGICSFESIPDTMLNNVQHMYTRS